MNAPSLVLLSQHATERMVPLGVTVEQVTVAVLEHHSRRRRNPREADWLVSSGSLRVAYNWPVGDDQAAALVVTVFRER
ncbi:MAG: hypothetical protein DLM63_00480 [Solirubrobacterales bacterium]|nr:MAG: hypothetical protein DLM63_00480 [Solirubrobacterales bacterium]